MSSILKALKKLENVPPPETGENTLQQRIAREPARAEPRRGLRPFVMGACFALLLVGVFLAGRFLSAPETVTTSTPAETVGPVAQEDTPVQRDLPVAEEREESVPVAVSPEPAPRTPLTRPAVSPEPAPRTPLTRPIPEERPPVVAVKPPTPRAKVPRSSRVERNATEAVAGTPAVVERPKPLVMPEPDLSLEGIVWSDAPGSRFAIINGSIVRQGGVVAGFRVKQISPDHVLIQSRDGTWQTHLFVK